MEKGDIFLMYTGHYNRTYAKGDIEGYQNYYTGLSYEAAASGLPKKVLSILVLIPLPLIRHRMTLIFPDIWYVENMV